MGASYCQWGGLTSRNIYNIYGSAHLASRDSAMLHLWNFYQFWLPASNTGNLPILGNPSTVGLLSFSNFWQVAKISWHAANSIPPDPPWFWIVPHIAHVINIGQEKAYFHGYLTLTFDLNFFQKSRVSSKIHPYTENQAPRSIGCGSRVCDGRKEGKLGNILWFLERGRCHHSKNVKFSMGTMEAFVWQ